VREAQQECQQQAKQFQCDYEPKHAAFRRGNEYGDSKKQVDYSESSANTSTHISNTVPNTQHSRYTGNTDNSSLPVNNQNSVSRISLEGASGIRTVVPQPESVVSGRLLRLRSDNNALKDDLKRFRSTMKVRILAIYVHMYIRFVIL
jgi:hypothetical protein